MRPIVVQGVGMHPFGRFDDKSVLEMGVEALRESLADAELEWSQVDALFCAHMYAGTGAGHKIATMLGRTGIPIVNLENACSSGGAAISAARQAIGSGESRTVAALGIEKMPRGFMKMDYFEDWRHPIGHAVNPVQFAFAARRHMHDYGTTEQQLALVAEKNHSHSVHNPRAMYRKEISVEEVLASRMVVDPLRLLMLCAPDEGAAAAILTAGEARPGDVQIVGQGMATALRSQAIGEHMPTDSSVEADVSVTRRAAEKAYEQAGLGPEDLDVVELQDTDSGNEIIATEELGLCARGEGGPLVESGATRIGGRLPVNPSGGLLSKGEPVGASALGQIFEIVTQLRGEAGPRQVEGARTGLTHALGAGGNCSVIVLQRA
ncbi:MAG: thiolase family protein [Solirubrobacterales bacterium]